MVLVDEDTDDDAPTSAHPDTGPQYPPPSVGSEVIPATRRCDVESPLPAVLSEESVQEMALVDEDINEDVSTAAHPVPDPQEVNHPENRGETEEVAQPPADLSEESLVQGQLNGRSPEQSSDLFAGETPQHMDMNNIQHQAVLAATGVRVTSAEGTQLDMISKVTANQVLGRLDLAPVSTVAAPVVHEQNNNTASGNSATEILDITSSLTEHDGERNSNLLSSLDVFSKTPGLSLSSLNDEVQSHEERTEQRSLNAIHGAEGGELPSGASTSHFAESNVPTPMFHRITSGYGSGGSNFEKSKEHSKEPIKDHSGSNCLQLSEVGINKVRFMSGTQRKPVKTEFVTLPKRLASYPEGFRVQDVQVNRDLLAFSGFYYSGHGTVTCFHCGCSPRVWGDGHDPDVEHAMISPYCRALRR